MRLQLSTEMKNNRKNGIAEFCRSHESGIYTDEASANQCQLNIKGGSLELRKEEGKLIQSYVLGNGIVKVIYDLEGNRK